MYARYEINSVEFTICGFLSWLNQYLASTLTTWFKKEQDIFKLVRGSININTIKDKESTILFQIIPAEWKNKPNSTIILQLQKVRDGWVVTQGVINAAHIKLNKLEILNFTFVMNLESYKYQISKVQPGNSASNEIIRLCAEKEWQ